MSFSNWKYAYASVMGTSHVKANLPCQDYSLCEMLNEQTLCIVVSDGAGSAIYADKGAKIACKETLDALKEYFADENTIAEINRNFAEESRSRILKAIHNQADLKSCTIRDFACTLLVAVIGETMAVFWQVGDGAIVVYEPHPTTEYRLFFQPAKGEYANMTEFITQKDVMLQFEIRRGKVDEVAIISDGLECLALNLKEQEAFAPFFQSMFAPLRLQDDGYSERASFALRTLLDSDRVNSRTDDDKTLVLATRRCPHSENRLDSEDT